MNRFKITIVLPLVALACASCEDKAEPDPIRPVLASTVTIVDSSTFGPFASIVEARYQAQLGFQTAGRMVARDVYVGDLVKKGQRLAALDPTVTQFALTRAKADIADAQAQLVNAEGVRSRQTLLVQGGNVAQATLDNATAGRDTAKARLQQAEASLRLAEDQVGYTELHASFDGVVSAWSAEVGQYVTNGQGVVTVARPDVREAVVDIPDNLISSIDVGMVFTVHLLASPDITAQATVREIGPLSDAATRSRRVRLTLQAPGPAFRLGTTITVAVKRPVISHAVLPAGAVVDQDGAAHVWVLASDGRSVSQRDVKIIGRDGDDLWIGSGLKTGDKVVTVGVDSLHDGQAVAGETGGATAALEGR